MDGRLLSANEFVCQKLGYTHAKLAAPTPAAALELLGAHGAAIDLLLADVAMPGMSGLELARRVRAGLPGAGVLLMSGYAPDLGEQLAEGMMFIRKPFARAQLDAKLRAALDARCR